MCAFFFSRACLPPRDWKGFNEILPRRCSKSWGKAGVKGLIAESILIDSAPGTFSHLLFIIPRRPQGHGSASGDLLQFGEQADACGGGSLLGSPGPLLLSRPASSARVFGVWCESGHKELLQESSEIRGGGRRRKGRGGGGLLSSWSFLLLPSPSSHRPTRSERGAGDGASGRWSRGGILRKLSPLVAAVSPH